MNGPAINELLVMLAEEGGELVQASTKAIRHGLQSFNPGRDDQRMNNLTDLRKELCDVLAVARLLEEHEGSPVNICHQCANDLDEPTMGSATYVEEE